MNIENIRKVRNLIANRPKGRVTMEGWGSVRPYSEETGEVNICGTVGCIGGWANVQSLLDHAVDGKVELYEDGYAVKWHGFSSPDHAAEYLGLDSDAAVDLFKMHRVPTGLSFFRLDGNIIEDEQRDLVVAVLDKLIETGRVPWNAVLKAGMPEQYERALREVRWSDVFREFNDS